MQTTFDKYLLRRFLYVYLVLLVSTYGLYVVIDGFTNVDAFQDTSQSITAVMQNMASYYAYQSSLFFDMIGSILAVTAVMVVFAMLLRQGELHPILASGVPTRRLIRPMVIGTLLVTIGVLLNRELVIPSVAYSLQAPRRADESRTRTVEPVYDHASHICILGRGLHLADRKLIGAQFVLPVPDLAEKLTTLTTEQATFYPARDERAAGWLLKDVQPPRDTLSLTPLGRKVVRRVKDPGDLFVITDISFEQLCYRSQSVQYASTGELMRRIRNPTFGTASVRGLVLNLHVRLMQPFINLTAAVLAVPLIVRRESFSLILNLAFCSIVLGAVYVAMEVSFYLGRANIIDPAIAAWTPVILSGTLSAWFFERMQT